TDRGGTPARNDPRFRIHWRGLDRLATTRRHNNGDSMIRIIGGEKRGAKLQTLEGDATRPLRDRVRESLFSIIQAEVVGARVLDCFPGSGAVGREALSRGAVHACFYEDSASAREIISANIEKLGWEQRTQVVGGLLPDSLGDEARNASLVFIMPPYHSNLAPMV